MKIKNLSKELNIFKKLIGRSGELLQIEFCNGSIIFKVNSSGVYLAYALFSDQYLSNPSFNYFVKIDSFKSAIGNSDFDLVVDSKNNKLIIIDSDNVNIEVDCLPANVPYKAPMIAKGLFTSYNVLSFLEPLQEVSKAISDDKGRPHLNALLFEKNRFVATDGHRLSIQGLLGLDVPNEPLISKEINDLIISVMRLSHKDDILYIFFDGSNDIGYYDFAFDNIKYKSGWDIIFNSTKLKFPPYHKIIPEIWNRGYSVKVKSDKLKKSLKKVKSVLANTRRVAVHLFIKNEQMCIEAKDYNDCKIKVLVPIETNCDNYKCCMNINYFIDAIPDNCDEVVIHFGIKNDEIIVVENTTTSFYCLMPMRI
jgi:DNA polymerase III sliding clamp (beta) subunit (PCNA family)